MIRLFFCFPQLIIMLLTFLSQEADITLSEIMFNPSGDENHNEFIEVYNYGSRAINLSNWRISDGTGTDIIIDAGMGTVVNPGQFAVILDNDYFANSSLYDSIIPDSALILTIDNTTFGSRGLSNSNPEYITLMNEQGKVISSYQYSIDNPDGHSDEKIIPEKENSPQNWSNSLKSGGTPGSRNSVLPPKFDLAVTDIKVIPLNPVHNEPLSIVVTIKNMGLSPAAEFVLRLFIDSNGNDIPEQEESIGKQDFTGEQLTYGDSITVTKNFQASQSGELCLTAIITYENDEIAENDTASTIILIPFEEKALIINEIMYYPLPERSEWIELYNPGISPVNIKNWKIKDTRSTGETVICKKTFIIEGNSYIVVAGDSSFFMNYPSVSFIVPSSGFPSLNNDGDELFLYDAAGSVIDYVNYKTDWGSLCGVSLERINPLHASGEKNNWNLSTDPRGSTPGEKNSILGTNNNESMFLSVEPNPFSPGNDGFEDHTEIKYSVPFRNPTIRIEIYDRKGRLIRTLVSGENTGSRKTILWDGKKDNGSIAAIGIYIIYFEAYDPETGKILSKKDTAVIAENYE